MDILELSHKMERDLLESRSKNLFILKPSADDTFSPRITRSQTNKGQTTLIQETDFQQKKIGGKIDEIEKILVTKKSRVVHKNLETIYENPIWKKGSTMLLGTSKVKRSIYLDREFRITSKQKSKLRKMKIKRLGKRIKPFKISDEEFKSKMLRIDNYLNDTDLEIHCDNDICDINFKSLDSKEDYDDTALNNVESFQRNDIILNSNNNSEASE